LISVTGSCGQTACSSHLKPDMKTLICIITTFTFAFLNTQAQIDTILWQNCLGTLNGTNWTYGVEKTKNGYLFGIYLTRNGPGVTNYHGAGDAWIVQTDFSGNVLWERCYGGSSADSPIKIIKITDSTFYLLNYTQSKDGDVLNGRDGNFWIVKINDTGEILWENSYGGSVNGEEVRDAILMPDNGLLMMGRIRSTGGDITTHYGDMDVWLCRIDSTGGIFWQKTLGNHGKDNGVKIKLSSHNTILFVGGHELTGGMIDCPDYGYSWTDVWVVELDLDGNLLNQWCYGGKYGDLGYDIVDVDDGYVIAASTCSNDRDVSGFHGIPGNVATMDIWVFKIDFSGNLIWQKCLGGSSWESPIYITTTEDNGFIVIGNTCSLDGDVSGNHSGGNLADIWVVKLNENGELVWEHCFGGDATERFWGLHCVYKNDDYNYVLAANSQLLDQDVQCDLFPDPYDLTWNAWLIEIKDCSFYLPLAPIITSGPDILCSTTNPVALYSIDTVQYATGYEWLLEPEDAGTLLSLDTLAEVTWNPQFEGQSVVRARSLNDCGNSGWSEPWLTMVYPCMGVNEHGGMEAWGRGGVTVWPNPAREVLSVTIAGQRSAVGGQQSIDKFTIEIYDIFGRPVISSPRLGACPVNKTGGGRDGGSSGREGEIRVDVSGLVPGIYLAVVKDSGSVLGTGKFIIIR
jgi:hypothetical protein